MATNSLTAAGNNAKDSSIDIIVLPGGPLHVDALSPVTDGFDIAVTKCGAYQEVKVSHSDPAETDALVACLLKRFGNVSLK